jgi:hypothetical protein
MKISEMASCGFNALGEWLAPKTVHPETFVFPATLTIKLPIHPFTREGDLAYLLEQIRDGLISGKILINHEDGSVFFDGAELLGSWEIESGRAI